MVEQQVDRGAPEAAAAVTVVADEDVQLSAAVRPVDLAQIAEPDEPVVLPRAQRKVAGLLGPRGDALDPCPLSWRGWSGANDPTSEA